MNPIQHYQKLGFDLLIPIQGKDKKGVKEREEVGTHFLLVYHQDADDLKEGEWEIALWVTNEKGERKDGRMLTCHLGDDHDFDRWEKAAKEGQLMSYLEKAWGSEL